jgi:membrane-bound lytic murein transglycosylase B
MVLIDHPQQQDVPPDETPAAAPSHGRHAARVESTPRFRHRHRWPVLAAVAALGVLVVPPPSPDHLHGDVAEAADASRNATPLGAAATISFLSSGAPTGAMVLPTAPAQVGDAAPIAPTVISGLAANGIPNVALNAYRVAAARMTNSSPDCGIDWSLLAGIGRIESNHGRFGGATLNSDGTSTPAIKGPPLNGGQFAFIRDTDGGAFDGDSAVDRAVGPMQFIPSTWKAYGADADGNGKADPFNINDAALAAAHYLCVAGGNLRTDPGQRKAVMAYNHSDSYVNEVLALAHAYANGIPVADIPLVGDTTAPVPPAGAFGTARYANGPVNPAPPMGAHDMTPANGPTTGASADGGQPAAPGAAPAASSSGGTPPATTGTSNTGTSTTGPNGTGTSPTGQPPSSGPAPSNPGTSPGSGPQPAGPAAPLPVPVPAPAPVPSPVPLPPPPPPPAAPVPGVTCTLLSPLGQPLDSTLPLCPPPA